MEKGKKSFGRRKIPIKKIEKKENLQVAFSKRRMGLFKKASELSILCGTEIAIFIQSPGKKMFAFGAPSVDSVLDRFEGRAAAAANLSMAQSRAVERSRKAFVEMERRLEREKEMEKKIKEMGPRSSPGFWWDGDIEDKNLEELQSFLESIEELKGNIDRRLEGMKVAHNPKLDDNVATAIPVVAAEAAGTSRQGSAVEYPPPQLDWQNFDGGMMMSMNTGFQSLLHDNIPVAVPLATAGPPYHQGGVVGYPPQLDVQNFDGGVMMMMMDGSMQSSMLHENGNMGTSSLLHTAASEAEAEASVRDFLQNYFS